MDARLPLAFAMIAGGFAFGMWGFRRFRYQDIRLSIALLMVGTAEGVVSVFRLIGIDKTRSGPVVAMGAVFLLVGVGVLLLAFWAMMVPPKLKAKGSERPTQPRPRRRSSRRGARRARPR